MAERIVNRIRSSCDRNGSTATNLCRVR